MALARALCAVRQGAGVVLLDEPTAQLDVRGEAEIFDRILAATRHTTTILISHRFSTVRHADRICVLEHGKVVELGTSRRADGGGRPLPDDVRAASVAVRRRRRRGRSESRCPRLTTCRRRLPAMWRALKRGYQAEPLLLSVAFGLALLAALPRRADRALAQVPRRGRARRPARAGADRPRSGWGRRRPRPGSCA